MGKRLRRTIWMTTVTPMEWFIPASRYKPRMCFTSAALLRMFLQSGVRIVRQAGFDVFDMFHITAAREDWKHSGDAIHLGEQITNCYRHIFSGFYWESDRVDGHALA